MKKIGFIVQVLTLIAALPVLSILEINHVNEKVAGKNTGNYMSSPAEKKSISFNAPANITMPGAAKHVSVKLKPGV